MITEMEYQVKNERGELVTVTTEKEAKTMIVATATVREHANHEELMKDTDLTSIADYFNINLLNLKIEPSKDYRDFAFTYSFS